MKGDCPGLKLEHSVSRVQRSLLHIGFSGQESSGAVGWGALQLRRYGNTVRRGYGAQLRGVFDRGVLRALGLVGHHIGPRLIVPGAFRRVQEAICLGDKGVQLRFRIHSDHPLCGPDTCGNTDAIRDELLDALTKLFCDSRVNVSLIVL
jgi:hypothetical protein